MRNSGHQEFDFSKFRHLDLHVLGSKMVKLRKHNPLQSVTINSSFSKDSFHLSLKKGSQLCLGFPCSGHMLSMNFKHGNSNMKIQLCLQDVELLEVWQIVTRTRSVCVWSTSILDTPAFEGSEV